ncbi:MAG: efflux RND transporter periplasmic adaptor subunit [Patescibacteria group bacterium]|nr:efflux RND transporter periplasmic adaptor subunit [Patescibacteria group bacterium]
MNKVKKLFTKILKSKRLLAIIICVIAIAGGTFYYITTVNRVYTDSAQVSAPIINVSPSVSGKLLSVNVYEEEKVKKGDELAVFDSDTVKAYTDGIIITVNKTIGTIMNAQTPAVQMIDPNEIRIVATIDENKGLNNVRVGQPASFTIDALPGKTFWGYVDEVAPSAKQTQMSFSISSERPVQQFNVYIKFNVNANPEIKNGMSAKVTIYTKNIPSK